MAKHVCNICNGTLTNPDAGTDKLFCRWCRIDYHLDGDGTLVQDTMVDPRDNRFVREEYEK